MATSSGGYDIEVRETIENNVSTITYDNTKDASPTEMRVYIDRDAIPKLQAALRRHSSIELTLGCKANLLKNGEIVQHLFRNKTITVNGSDINNLHSILNLQFKELEDKISESKDNVFLNFNSITMTISGTYGIEIREALENNVSAVTYHNTGDASTTEMRVFIDRDAIPKLQAALRRHSSIKLTLGCKANLLKNEKIVQYLFRNKTITINASDIDNLYGMLNLQFEELEDRIAESNVEGSDNVFLNFNSTTVTYMKNSNMAGSSYIELPKFIKDKKAVINVKNSDEYCIIWAVLASLYPVAEQACRITKYKIHFNKINRGDLQFPLKIKDIPKFEKLNNLAINVFGYSYENNIESYYPLHISEYIDLHPIDLLYMESDDIDENHKKSNHYALIKYFSRLVHNSLNPNDHHEVICKRCMIGFTNESAYNKHLYYCTTGNTQCVMPEEGYNDVIVYKNHIRKHRHPLIIAADFETVLIDMNKKVSETSQEIKKKQHIISSAAYCSVGAVNKFKQFRGEQCLDDFIKSIEEVINEYNKVIQQHPNVELTTEEAYRHHQRSKCWICGGEFSDEIVKSKKGNDWKPYGKVIDHDHISGHYLGAAHNECNLRRRTMPFIPIYFHNLSRYDSHLIINVINKFGSGNIEVIPHTEEEYISFSKSYSICNKHYEIRFLDSYRLMPESLDELSSNLLAKGQEYFKNLLKFTSPEEQEVIFWSEEIHSVKIQTVVEQDWNVKFNEVKCTINKPRIKGVYPYSFTDSFEKFKYSQEITREQFYDELNMKQISNQEYSQYLKVWNSIPDVNLGKYSDLYLKIDVLALADVLESFRSLCIDAYELDPCYYYTSPGLTWDACLKYTGIELNLLTDYRMLQMIEHGIRGGISGVTGDRYIDVESKNYVTNPNIDKDDPTQQWLLYIDANNLYGYSMSHKLPYSGFKWLSENEIANLDSLIRNHNITGDEDIGYILSVDLEVPNSKKFENFPLAPESKIIQYDQLSDYSKALLNNDSYPKTSKLILDFTNKQKYTIHIKNLLLYYQLGAEFKINEAISFNQSNWLQAYIDYNTEMRKKANNDFEINFFKLMNNSMFGKTMEAIRNRIDMKLADDWKRAKFYIRKPTFDYLKIFNENLVAIHMRKNRIVFNKPIYIGFCVLEISKLYMYSCYYNRLQHMFRDVRLTYIDTDSFVLHIIDSNIYKIMQENADLFDFSNYPKDHILYSTANKKVVGKFKDECEGNIMLKRIQLKSKMYCHHVYLQQQEAKRAKGIKSCVVKKCISFQDYYNCLFYNKPTEHNYQHFKSIDHQIFTVESTKSGLTAFDSKRYYLDSVRSIPFSKLVL